MALFLIFLGMMLVPLPKMNVDVTPQVTMYADIPLSKHAQQDHQGQAWNAVEIHEYFKAGKCKPKIDICEEDDFEVHYCQVNDGMSIGLVIGHTIRQVITGYMARTSYWTSRCGGI